LGLRSLEGFRVWSSLTRLVYSGLAKIEKFGDPEPRKNTGTEKMKLV
jgi:hypothetical protein